ncbi:hypothetical protein QL285_080976 [Trifolium repens]|nr:hypothetical protein QL285_080976 [Trifolium repens]
MMFSLFCVRYFKLKLHPTVLFTAAYPSLFSTPRSLLRGVLLKQEYDALVANNTWSLFFELGQQSAKARLLGQGFHQNMVVTTQRP